MTTHALRALQRKLERLELEHLRRHALELHEHLEDAEARLRHAEEDARHAEQMAEFWRESCLQAQEALDDENFAHRAIGLTQDGALLVVRHD